MSTGPPQDLSGATIVTFVASVASLLLLIVVALSVGWIVSKVNELYERLPASKEDTVLPTAATPTTSDALADNAKPSDVKVEPATTQGPDPLAKAAHILSIIVSGVIAVAVAIVLADGTSVIKLKDPEYLPIITNPSLKSIGIDHRADELLGPTYGIGLHHDQSGAIWTEVRAGSTLKQLEANLGLPVIAAALPSVIATDDLKHPVPFLECHDLQTAGLAAVSLGYIAETVAVLMVIFHTLALAGALPAKATKMLAVLVWFTLTTGFLTVVLLAIGIYTAVWECDNTIIPSIKIEDHFEYNYGFPFAITGFVSSLLILAIQMACTSTKAGSSGSVGKAVVQVLGGVTIGLIVAGLLSVAVLGSQNVFEDPPAVNTSAVNPCAGQKPKHAGPGDKYFENTDCMKDSVIQVLEQAGANVTKGYVGGLDAGDRVPITVPYSQTDLCPVNVHWHYGAEHYSAGEYDEGGSGPGAAHHRRLAENQVRKGFQCHHYDSHDPKFTTEYQWEHCEGMHVGETYEIHWPHSAAGACGTEWQYQTPFYDGVFCRDGVITIAPLNTYEKIGVQAQIFTIVNDNSSIYYSGSLIDGMIVDGDKGADIAMYTGSTTGTSRNNVRCSRYTPITWQVDRKCHMISASSFDKLCADMKAQRADMSNDLHAHGSRELVADHLVADNQQSRK